MKYLKPFEHANQYLVSCLEMSDLCVSDQEVSLSVDVEYYHKLLSLRDDLRCQTDDLMALRLLLTRICGTFATCLRVARPMSLQILLKTEFVKLQGAYRHLDKNSSGDEQQNVVHMFLESVDSVLVMLEQRFLVA